MRANRFKPLPLNRLVNRVRSHKVVQSKSKSQENPHLRVLQSKSKPQENPNRNLQPKSKPQENPHKAK